MHRNACEVAVTFVLYLNRTDTAWQIFRKNSPTLNLPETGPVIEFIIPAQKDGHNDFNKCSPRDTKMTELIIFSDIFP